MPVIGETDEGVGFMVSSMYEAELLETAERFRAFVEGLIHDAQKGDEAELTEVPFRAEPGAFGFLPVDTVRVEKEEVSSGVLYHIVELRTDEDMLYGLDYNNDTGEFVAAYGGDNGHPVSDTAGLRAIDAGMDQLRQLIDQGKVTRVDLPVA